MIPSNDLIDVLTLFGFRYEHVNTPVNTYGFCSGICAYKNRLFISDYKGKSFHVMNSDCSYVGSYKLPVAPYHMTYINGELLFTALEDKAIYHFDPKTPGGAIKNVFPDVEFTKPIFLEGRDGVLCLSDGPTLRLFDGKRWSAPVAEGGVRAITPVPEGFWAFMATEKSAVLLSSSGTVLKRICFESSLANHKIFGHVWHKGFHFIVSGNVVWKFDESGKTIYRTRLHDYRFNLSRISEIRREGKDVLAAYDVTNAEIIIIDPGCDERFECVSDFDAVCEAV